MVKKRIYAASLLVIAGLIVLAKVTAGNRNFTKLDIVEYDTVTYEVGEQFASISVDSYISDISFIPCDGDFAKVVCYKPRNSDYSVDVNGDNLFITENYDYKDNIRFFNFKNPTISVYMPQNDYKSLIISSKTGDTYIPGDFDFESVNITATTGDVKCMACASDKIKIALSTGDITVERTNSEEMELSVTTGSIDIMSVKCTGDLKVNVRTGRSKLSSVKCQNFISKGNTGDINLKDVIAEDMFYIERSTGDVIFEACDAHGITVTTSTGSVRGTLLSEKLFIAKSNTGSVKVPQTVTGGNCDIKTKTGDIKISLQ